MVEETCRRRSKEVRLSVEQGDAEEFPLILLHIGVHHLGELLVGDHLSRLPLETLYNLLGHLRFSCCLLYRSPMTEAKSKVSQN